MKTLYFKLINVCLYAIIIIGIGLFVNNAISKYFLGYDESGQFYIAKGLCHYSLPNSDYGGLFDVIFFNRYFNLDPGGYSILMHFWTLISNHYIWMRLLSLVFFFGAVVLIYNIGLKLSNKDKTFAAFLTSVYFIASPFPFISSLIRAYSMEMFGIACSLYYLLIIRNSLELRELVVLAFIHCIFMTSRYDFVVYSIAVFLCVGILLLKRNRIKGYLTKMLAFGSILLFGAILVFFLSMHYQNSHAVYMPYMSYIGSDYTLLWSWMSIRFYTIIISSCLLWYYIRLDLILVLSVIVNSLFFILSIANYFPWDPWKTLSVTIMQYMALTMLLYNLICICKRIFLRLMYLTIYSIFLFFVLLNNDIYPKLSEQSAFEELHSFANHIEDGESIYISPLLNPDIRYQYEEGLYKKEGKSLSYYKNLLLASDISHALTTWVIIGDTIKPDDVDCKYYLLIPTSKVDTTKYSKVPSYKYIFTKKAVRCHQQKSIKCNHDISPQSTGSVHSVSLEEAEQEACGKNSTIHFFFSS